MNLALQSKEEFAFSVLRLFLAFAKLESSLLQEWKSKEQNSSLNLAEQGALEQGQSDSQTLP